MLRRIQKVQEQNDTKKLNEEDYDVGNCNWIDEVVTLDDRR